MKITIDTPMIDYFTATTFDRAAADRWLELIQLAEVHRYGACVRDIETRGRYKGYRGVGEHADVFLGQGKQKGKDHWELQCSGATSDVLFYHFCKEPIGNKTATCTRIDIQVTVTQPEEWSQIEYLRICEEHGLKPEVRRSRDGVNRKGELITVYTGTRTCGRMNRLYQKVMMSGELLLRYETEFSRGYSKSIAYALVTGKADLMAIHRGELQRRALDCLKIFDSGQGFIFQPKQEKREVLDKKEQWLLYDILPVFTKYINSDDANIQVLDAFLSVIDSYMGGKE